MRNAGLVDTETAQVPGNELRWARVFDKYARPDRYHVEEHKQGLRRHKWEPK